MGTVSSIAVTPVLSKTDILAGIAGIVDLDTVQRWIKRGKSADDIEMELPNVIKRAVNYPKYQVMRNRLCGKYQIDEFTLVGTLLRQIATS
jgi:hypothetical protein